MRKLLALVLCALGCASEQTPPLVPIVPPPPAPAYVVMIDQAFVNLGTVSGGLR
jgi:hypothetical protein